MTDVAPHEKYGQPAVVEFWRELSLLGLQDGEAAMMARYAPRRGRVLDLGCGAGRVALALGPHDHVVGLDVTRSMVRAARSLLAEHGRTPRLVQADLTAIPCGPDTFDTALLFNAAIQHVPQRPARREALAEICRVLAPGGVLVVAVDNIAPALACYAWWLFRLIRRTVTRGPGRRRSRPEPSLADRRLSHRPPGVRRVLWHARGLARTLRWRTWASLVDRCRELGLGRGEPGDTRVAQVAMPSTPGTVGYHVYRSHELADDAAAAGLRLVATHSASETDGERAPAWIRAREKQVFYVLCRDRRRDLSTDGREAPADRCVRRDQ